MAGKRIYKVTLTDEERDLLRAMLSSGKAAARKLNHARLLLYADEAAEGLRRTDQEIADTLGIGPRTVERVRQRFVEEGSESALVPRPRPRGAYNADFRGGVTCLVGTQFLGQPGQFFSRFSRSPPSLARVPISKFAVVVSPSAPRFLPTSFGCRPRRSP